MIRPRPIAAGADNVFIADFSWPMVPDRRPPFSWCALHAAAGAFARRRFLKPRYGGTSIKILRIERAGLYRARASLNPAGWDIARRPAARRYSPGDVVAVERHAVIGRPSYISTSYVERQNLTLRMQQRRLARLTNGFSKKLDHHVAAIGLYVAHYNFCRVHESLGRRETPAMALGLTDHAWTIGELLETCLANAPRDPRKERGPRQQFRVIEGGLK